MCSKEDPLVLVSMDEIRWTSCMVIGRTLAGDRRAGAGSRTVSKPDLELDLDLEDLEDLVDGVGGELGTISMKRWLWE